MSSEAPGNRKQYKYHLVVILRNTNISDNNNNIDNQYIKINQSINQCKNQ